MNGIGNWHGYDAAGLALSERLRAQISSSQQGVRNLSDGISALRVAEGALQESSNILNRQRELVIQAKNGTLNESQRHVIQNEYDSLTQELNRIAEVTDFNGKSLLNGDSSEEALAESNSRIRDTDYAREVSEQTKNSILQQFSIAIQAQANASKGVALKLLGGG